MSQNFGVVRLIYILWKINISLSSEKSSLMNRHGRIWDRSYSVRGLEYSLAWHDRTHVKPSVMRVAAGRLPRWSEIKFDELRYGITILDREKEHPGNHTRGFNPKYTSYWFLSLWIVDVKQTLRRGNAKRKARAKSNLSKSGVCPEIHNVERNPNKLRPEYPSIGSQTIIFSIGPLEWNTHEAAQERNPSTECAAASIVGNRVMEGLESGMLKMV